MFSAAWPSQTAGATEIFAWRTLPYLLAHPLQRSSKQPPQKNGMKRMCAARYDSRVVNDLQIIHPSFDAMTLCSRQPVLCTFLLRSKLRMCRQLLRAKLWLQLFSHLKYHKQIRRPCRERASVPLLALGWMFGTHFMECPYRACGPGRCG